LIGHDGIFPADAMMAAARQWADSQGLGVVARVAALPTLCWFDASDLALRSLSVGGTVLGVLLTVGVAPAVVVPILWVLYLSLSIVAGDFLSFQWDALLLEAGFLAILVAPVTWFDRFERRADPPRMARWMLWWLLFRLMFGSGVVKLTSGDPMWRGLTALSVHYETQPLPTPLGWYAHHLPAWFAQWSTASVLGIELLAPFLIFAPRILRLAGCSVLVGFQVLIAATGNYAFFNLLTVALCVLLVDDQVHTSGGENASGAPPFLPRWASFAVAAITLPVTSVVLAGQLGIAVPGAGVVSGLSALIGPFRSVNGYGLFAVMTPTRPEIIVEGSSDGTTWRPYEFKFKPGDLRRRPPWVAPHQPRLDWQMWFAALDRYETVPWFPLFCQRLLEGSPPVLALLANNPFPKEPPRFVRAVLYRYFFADFESRTRDGVWWVRQELGPYSPVLSLASRAPASR
jgi:hypothetical protein